MLDPALVYIPRGIDNSTGGFATVRSSKFGTLGDKMLCLSWGACSSIMVLRDKPEGAKRYQGLSFLLKEIISVVFVTEKPTLLTSKSIWLVTMAGVPILFPMVACSDFATGQPVYYPETFRTYKNGIKLTFAEKLDKSTAENIKNLFAQQWNYKYSNAYGSPEYSVKNPNREGHDVLTVKASYYLDSGKTLFVEIPDIDPAMTIHLFEILKEQLHNRFDLNIFMTALHLEKPFTQFPGYQKPPEVVAREGLKLP